MRGGFRLTNVYSLRTKAWLVFKATRQHARNLALFSLVYKSSMLFLRHTSPTGKERHYDAFLAGLIGGYTIFGRTIHNSVSQQIVIYVFARVCLALAKLAVQPRGVGKIEGGGGGMGLIVNEDLRKAVIKNAWPAFASLSWAAVMYVFRWHPETVQPSLRSSMSYMWVILSFISVLLDQERFLSLLDGERRHTDLGYSYVQSDDWDSLRTFLWHNK
jgi:hypothetical protein